MVGRTGEEAGKLGKAGKTGRWEVGKLGSQESEKRKLLTEQRQDTKRDKKWEGKGGCRTCRKRGREVVSTYSLLITLE